jgi:predicted dehydrogenase
VNVALVGAGRIAEVAHLPAWRTRRDARVTVVVDADAGRAESLARGAAIAEWTTDYRAVIQRPDVDAVDICLPPHLHRPVTEDCLAAGKHVLLEKPLATTLPDARRLVAAARQSGRVLMIAENWPFSTAARRAQALLTEGVLGEVFLVKAHHEAGFYIDRARDARGWVQRLEEAGGGYLMDAGIHTISLARHLCGEFASVFAQASPATPPTALEEDVVLVARFRSGALGAFDFTGRSRHLGERRLGFSLFGSRGVCDFDVWSGRVSWTVDGVRQDVEDARFSRGFAEEIAHFLDCITSGKPPLTSAEQQVASVATVLAIYRSVHEQRPVDPHALLVDSA